MSTSTAPDTSPTDESKPQSIIDRIKAKIDSAMNPLKKFHSTNFKRKSSDSQEEYLSRLSTFQKFVSFLSSY